jgi:sulfate adenylyltransferase subunit 2
MTYRNELVNKSIYIIREVQKRFKNPALLWSIGKDSTTMVWLCRQAFFGKVPFPVIHIDTEYKFKEIYEFRKKYAKKWNLNLIVSKNQEAIDKGITPDNGKFECCNARKTQALMQLVKEMKIDALIVGIRRDEHGIRNKERYFSPRDEQFKWHYAKERLGGDSNMESEQDAEFDGWNIFSTDFGDETDHVRVHPLLHWTELDIWEHIREEKIPVVDLYFAKNGKRYRSIGCECCCKPVDSNANDIDKIIEELKTTKVAERAGREQDKEDEYNMEKLRSLGYM